MTIKLNESPSCNLMTLEGSFFKALKTNHTYSYNEKEIPLLVVTCVHDSCIWRSHE